ncbi:hypothetical protein BG61_29560 [Caballeronia glathei]|uniref:Uncharacterized protein n=1 Tax=Caballeronia glathei TaxID=60547 RepID=A0A069PRH7_9BURK|nr:hypothetical protein BG61_29560 [Caballeronia glathei]
MDFEAIKISMEFAAFVAEVDEYTQLSVFTDAMPKIHTMRRRGFSFRQITRVLNSAGMSLTYASVRTYYYRLYPTMVRECERYARKQIERVSILAAGDVEQTELTCSTAARAPRASIERGRAGTGCVRRASDQ